MEEITKETVTTQEYNISEGSIPTSKNKASNSLTVEYLVYFFFGSLEALLIIRFFLKLAGASVVSDFVNFIYNITKIAIWPFEGIFSKWFSAGAETTSVLEPATIIAIIIYALLAWGIVTLVQILSRQQQES
jgi:hypothetical protein